jgi:hypothetical protein
VIPFKDLSANGIKPNTVLSDVGTSHNYLEIGSIPHPFLPYSESNRLIDQPHILRSGKGTSDKMKVTPGARDDYSVTFRIHGSTDNPIVTPSAAIDWEFQIKLGFENANTVTTPKWELLDSFQDGFPGYELYIRDSDGSGGNNLGHPMYRFNPSEVGNTPFDLFPGFGDVYITPTKGNVP